MTKSLIWRQGGTNMTVAFVTDTYAENGNFYVGLVDCNDKDFYPCIDITTNIGEVCPETCAFIDINNYPGIDNWLMANGIAEPTGNWGISGCYLYPEFHFNMNKVYEYGEKMK